jgi:hypothetical protein
MLSHPWLSREDSYDNKYSDREYEVMMLKKNIKPVTKGEIDVNDPLANDPQEMSELIESDFEDHGGDREDGARPVVEDGEITDEEREDSFIDSDEDRTIKKKIKESEIKINNSFTGPYPIDPTDFNHTDKGPNA